MFDQSPYAKYSIAPKFSGWIGFIELSDCIVDQTKPLEVINYMGSDHRSRIAQRKRKKISSSLPTLLRSSQYGRRYFYRVRMNRKQTIELGFDVFFSYDRSLFQYRIDLVDQSEVLNLHSEKLGRKVDTMLCKIDGVISEFFDRKMKRSIMTNRENLRERAEKNIQGIQVSLNKSTARNYTALGAMTDSEKNEEQLGAKFIATKKQGENGARSRKVRSSLHVLFTDSLAIAELSAVGVSGQSDIEMIRSESKETQGRIYSLSGSLVIDPDSATPENLSILRKVENRESIAVSKEVDAINSRLALAKKELESKKTKVKELTQKQADRISAIKRIRESKLDPAKKKMTLSAFESVLKSQGLLLKGKESLVLDTKKHIEKVEADLAYAKAYGSPISKALQKLAIEPTVDNTGLEHLSDEDRALFGL